MFQVLEGVMPEFDARMMLKGRNECIAGFVGRTESVCLKALDYE